MVGVLIRMKLTILRNTMTGGRLAWMIIGGGAGTLLGIGTIWFSLAPGVGRQAVGDLLAVIYLTWLLGWIAGPLWTGAPVLRPEHFTLLGLPRRRLAAGLLGAAFVGVTPVVTLITFTSMISYGARLGFLPFLVAVSATVLQLVSGVLDSGFPGPVSAVLRALPSGWGLAVVEAAGRGSRAVVLGGSAGIAVILVALLWVWSRGLGVAGAGRVTIRGSREVAPPRRGLFVTRTGAVVLKELRAWRRDPGRIQAMTVPLVWAFGTALLPLAFGSTVLLPWAAPMLALMAATAAVNFLGDSGTALWLTLHAGAEQAEIRGRQGVHAGQAS